MPEFFIPVGLGVVTFLTYFSTLSYGFIFDDLPTITNYFYIRFFAPVAMILHCPRWLSRTLQQFIYHNWQINPFAYRVVNLVILLLIGTLVFFTVLHLLKGLKKNNFLKENAYIASTFITALFLFHPVQTQTATYISQMELEGLVVLFTFATLLPFICASRTQNAFWRNFLYGLSFLFLVISSGTKEISIVLPALILLIDWFFIAEGDWANFKSRIFLHVAYFVVTFGLYFYLGWTPKAVINAINTPLINNRGNLLTPVREQNITTWCFFISQFKVMLHYIFIFFWPFAISFDYDTKLSMSFFQFDVIVPMLVLIAIFAYAFNLFLKNKSNIFSFSVAWFFVAMLPRTSFIPSTELICDYKTYLASFGVLFLIGWLLMRVYARAIESIKIIIVENQRFVGQVFLLGLSVLFLIFSTNQRNKVWQSELAFWEDVIKKAPTKARGYNNYATALVDAGREADGIKYYNKALECDPVYGEPHLNMATIYHIKGDFNKAFEHYGKAIQSGEGHPELFHNLGVLQMTTGNLASAESCFKQAIELRFVHSKSHFCLGNVYRSQGKLKEALVCYENALKGNEPTLEIAHAYGLLCCDMGRVDNAIEIFSKMDPNYKDSMALLGECYYIKHDYKKASEVLSVAYKKDPSNPAIVYNYAMALLNSGKHADALPLFDKCNNPDVFPFAALHMAKCTWELGKKKEAATMLKKLVQTSKHEAIRRDSLSLMKEVGIA